MARTHDGEVPGEVALYETFVICILAFMRWHYEHDPEYYWDRQHETFV